MVQQMGSFGLYRASCSVWELDQDVAATEDQGKVAAGDLGGELPGLQGDAAGGDQVDVAA